MNHAKSLILLDFFSDQCYPCKLLMEDLYEISNEFKDIEIRKVNIMEEYDLTEKYKVRSVPTLILIENSNILASYVGYKGKDDLKNFLFENTKEKSLTDNCNP